MRILYLSNLYPPFYVGGYELRCADHANAMRTRGHEVHVLTSDHGLDANPKPANEEHVTRSLRINGFFGHAWHGIRSLRELEFHNNNELRRIISSFKPDVVHAWNLGGISKSLIITLERLNVPTVYEISDHWIARSIRADVWMRWWNRNDLPLPAKIARAALTAFGSRSRTDAVAPTGPFEKIRFPRICFCSDALKQITVKADYDVRHGEVIHCAVNVHRFTGTVASADTPLRRLLYVGRLAEDKGTMTALRALAIARDQLQVELRIYGKGDADYTAKLHDFVREHSLPVSFHSGTPDEMPAIYRAHDALIFTSEWEEPFALTPLEAMASGLPVIATMTGGSAELFRHGENALTYDAGETEQLAARMIELASSGTLRNRIALAGQREVKERCSEEVVLAQSEACLRETIERWPEFAKREMHPTAAAQPANAPTGVKALSPA